MSSNQRGVLQIAAVIGNALIGVVLLAFGCAALVALLGSSIAIGGETWESLGTQVASQLGPDATSILQLFDVNLSTLFADFAASQGLPPLDVFTREILAATFVGLALFIQAGVTVLVAARGIWRLQSAGRGLLRLYGVVLTLIGAAGLAIAAAPHLIWGLIVALGLLTLAALRTTRTTQPPYSV
jgi:hypothetical protein